MYISKNKEGFRFKLGVLGWLTLILCLFVFTENTDKITELFSFLSSTVESIVNSKK